MTRRNGMMAMVGGKGELNVAMVMFGAALDCPRYSKGLYREFEPPWARERIKQQSYCQ